MATAITSAANPRLRQAVKLRSGRQRRKSGLIIVDGVREIARALRYDCELVQLFVSSAAAKRRLPEEDKQRLRDELFGERRLDGFRLDVEPRLFEQLQFGNRDEGVVAVFRRPDTALARLQPARDAPLIVLDRLENPGNAGAVLRSADAAGCRQVVFCDPACELFSPTMIRSSLGTCFSTQLAEATHAELAAWLPNATSALFTARPEADDSLWECDFVGSPGLVFGSESHGLEDRWNDAGMRSFKIPMAGVADSLNLAASVAVTLYEARRQRIALGLSDR